MSHREVDRLGVVQAVRERRLRQGDAALQLGLSVRQVKRLCRRHRDEGAAGLVSRHRTKRPNNAIADSVRDEALALLRARYPDFGPTLAHEKLTECHGYAFSVESVRQWMMADGLWKPKAQRKARIHQSRPRRPCRGELVQIDGSPHDWFEGRGPYCTLLVFIDDATSELMALRLVPAETTEGYMTLLREYLDRHGRPVALYSDRHSIFRVNHPDHDGELTQFSRALKTLDIEPIHANTPQAKGRVERANQTLQDRLVKELRLHGISDMNAANAFLPTFMAAYNTRFAKPAQSAADAHRCVLHDARELALIVCLQHTRKLSKNLSFRFHNGEYQLTTPGHGYRLRGASVTVCEGFDGRVNVLYNGQSLPWRLLAQGERPIPLDDEKSLNQTINNTKKRQGQHPTHKPAPDHPWKAMVRVNAERAATS
jgi:hypothetical protein